MIGKWFLFGLVVIVQAMITTAALSNPLLTREAFALVQEFEDTTSRSFGEHFANMAHQREKCFGVRADDCQVPLQKRVSDYYLIVKGQKHFTTTNSNNPAKAAEEALLEVLTQFRNTTGLRAIFDKPQGARDYIYLVFVNAESVSENFDIYVKGRIARDSFGHPQERTELFRGFIDNNYPCQVVHSFTKDNTIHAAHIWIRSDLSEIKTKQCVAEEFYNSFGLSEGVEVGSIFDYEFSHKAGDISLSVFDLLLLKILYSDELPRGIDHANTVEIVEKMVLEARTAYQ